MALALAVAISGARAEGADDDWEVVEHTTTTRPDTSDRASAGTSTRGNQAASAQVPNGAPAGTFIACGEPARPAQEPYKSIVATLNQMWGTHAKVYESVTPMSPHASTGGCIFYNTEFQQMLTSRWMGITDDDQLRPMLYAINAHELGHIIHGDLDARRAGVPLETKELEADRFAGYTLKKLDVPATGLAPYWSMTGDEFGMGASHGTSVQRVAAFKEGWHEAEWNRAENSMSVTDATQESIAPEDSSAAP